jgi:hypothetical protein
MTDSKLTEKIRKLAAMANAQESPNEAAIAAQKLQDLLLEHNLELADVLAKEGPGSLDKIIHLSIVIPEIDNSTTWQINLFKALARGMYCQQYGFGKASATVRDAKGILRTVVSDRILLVGRQTDIEAVIEIGNYLTEQIRKMATEHYKLSGTSMPKKGWKRSFSEGAVAAIADKVYLNWEAARKNTNMSALVVVTEADIKKHVEAEFGGVRHTKSTRGSGASHSARSEGYQAGSKLDPTKKSKLGGGNKSLGE